jgi:hypothetical protein
VGLGHLALLRGSQAASRAWPKSPVRPRTPPAARRRPPRWPRSSGSTPRRWRPRSTAVRPDAGDRSGRRGSGDLTEDLAEELGIEEERVDEAFDALGEAREREHEMRMRELADQLAAKLNVSQEKVRELVADGGLLGGRGHRGPGGGPGPGGGRP